jgi:hypothetical protein
LGAFKIFQTLLALPYRQRGFNVVFGFATALDEDRGGEGGRGNTLLSREVDFYDEAMRLERRQSLKVLEACLRGYH